MAMLRRQAGCVDQPVIDRLQVIAILHQDEGVAVAERHRIPLDIPGLHLRLDFRDCESLGLDNADAGHRLERFVDRAALCVGQGPAGIGDSHLAGAFEPLRDGRNIRQHWWRLRAALPGSREAASALPTKRRRPRLGPIRSPTRSLSVVIVFSLLDDRSAS